MKNEPSDTLKAGTRIYYGGDQCNDSGFGTVEKQYTNKWGTFVDCSLDDGRTMLQKTPISAFSAEYLGHGGTSLVTEKAFRIFRKKQMDAMKAQHARVLARA